MDEKFATFATTFSLNLILCHSLGDLHYEYDSNSPVNHGTPSHLSIGTSSLNTATWTEGTPSFTESTMSGSLGRASADHHGQFECCWKLAQMLLWSSLSLCCIYVNVLPLFFEHFIEIFFTTTYICNPDQCLHFFSSFFISTVVWLFYHCWLRVFWFSPCFFSPLFCYITHHVLCKVVFFPFFKYCISLNVKFNVGKLLNE